MPLQYHLTCCSEWRKRSPAHPLPSGELIEARIGKVNYAQTVNPSTGVGSQDTRIHSVTSGFNYGSSANFQVCEDDPATGAIEGGVTGDSVVFFVAGIQAEARRVGVDGSPQTSILFGAGSATQRIDLTILSLTAPKAIPASTSTSACVTAPAPVHPQPRLLLSRLPRQLQQRLRPPRLRPPRHRFLWHRPGGWRPWTRS